MHIPNNPVVYHILYKDTFVGHSYAVNVTIHSMDVGIGNSLIIFFLIFLVFAFVALLINMLVSCCDETLGDDTDPNAAIIAASLNSRINRQTSHYRFRYDIPYDANERRATIIEVSGLSDSDFELATCSDRYGYALPPAPENLNLSPLSRAASHRSTHSSINVELPPVTNGGLNSFLDSSSASTANPLEEPPPSYDEIVGNAASFI